ncbi:GNAT family N-acetyltransferase [Streptomyces gilvosporeus]|uniref:GNAT family N-acetyltransferase n=1 Tax=Streptomyces gilvosporeus TaxID=553510 RepID=A0A1V0TJZ8_9ACTN|nr:GNAT family N-acetyltransferase [Streptomyces gilvosporeus]ARF53261.1 GNAT family N-acetyltransferase [Streptomyces gilvosporeus]
MPTLTVRTLRPEDWRLCRAVRLAALTEAPQAFGSTLSREESLTEKQWRERLAGHNQFLAEEDGEPCGLAGVVPVGPHTAELVSMWVRPATRGTGAADLLVRAVLRWADDEGIDEVRLQVTEGNTAAERLYVRHGFRRTGSPPPPESPVAGGEFTMIRTFSDLSRPR